jgi:hypothetical protein
MVLLSGIPPAFKASLTKLSVLDFECDCCNTARSLIEAKHEFGYDEAPSGQHYRRFRELGRLQTVNTFFDKSMGLDIDPVGCFTIEMFPKVEEILATINAVAAICSTVLGSFGWWRTRTPWMVTVVPWCSCNRCEADGYAGPEAKSADLAARDSSRDKLVFRRPSFFAD